MEQRIQHELDVIVEGILQTVPAEAIYLFGSYANGTPNEDSDLDIYVVVPDIDIRPQKAGGGTDYEGKYILKSA